MLAKRFLAIFISSLMLLNAGCIRFVPYEPHRMRGNISAGKDATYHEVKPGETLYSIAFEHGRDHRDVARWNKIFKPYTIYPKQKIRVIPIRSDAKSTVHFNKTVTASNHSKKYIPVSPRASIVSNTTIKWQWPTEGKVDSTFSYHDPGRRGIDIVGKRGQPVNAAAAGQVVYRGNGLRGYGNLIILQHNETYFSAYAHTDDVVVKENEKVKLGQKLADMSDTSSDKIKLHFEIRRNGKSVDPLKYLPKRR